MESLDAMPLLWKIDDGLIAMDALPGLAGKRAKKTLLEMRSRTPTSREETLFRRRWFRQVGRCDAKGLADLKARLTKHPLFVGTLIDDRGPNDHGSGCPAQEDGGVYDVKESIGANSASGPTPSRSVTNWDDPSIVGPPVLLADGFNSIDVDGRTAGDRGDGPHRRSSP